MAAEAVALLRSAQRLHAAHRIEEALAECRRALAINPGYVEAWTYLGTTLVTRRLAFPEGLAALEQALALAPDDAGVNYSLGWCYEFVAYRLEKLRPEPIEGLRPEPAHPEPSRRVEGQATRPYRDPRELYELAAQHLQRCIDLDPEPGLKEDAQDLLDSILDRL